MQHDGQKDKQAGGKEQQPHSAGKHCAGFVLWRDAHCHHIGAIGLGPATLERMIRTRPSVAP